MSISLILTVCHVFNNSPCAHVCFVSEVSSCTSLHRLPCITFACLPVHCVTAADHTLMSSVAAKKHELSQAAAAGHGVNRHTALQSSAPKFGLCYFCILMSLVYLLSSLFCKYWCVVCS